MLAQPLLEQQLAPNNSCHCRKGVAPSVHAEALSQIEIWKTRYNEAIKDTESLQSEIKIIKHNHSVALRREKRLFNSQLRNIKTSLQQKYKHDLNEKIAENSKAITAKFIQKQEYLTEQLAIARTDQLVQAKNSSGYRSLHHIKKLSQVQEELELTKSELKKVEANYRLLKQQYYGKKNEGKKKKSENNPKNTNNSSGTSNKKKPRGHQNGSPGHGPRKPPNLPIREEFLDISEEDKVCSKCNLSFQELNCTDDSNIVEIEVKGYIRRVKRKKYKRNKNCKCLETPAIIRAPAKPRLFIRSKLGVSIWVESLLAKYNCYIPLNRHLNNLELQGLPIATGTVVEGFKRLLPLFVAVGDEFQRKNQQSTMWHVDETSWKVFEKIDGKSGTSWYLWVFLSSKAATYFVTPRRNYEGADLFFKDISNGVVICDRYSVYKKLDNTTRLLVAYCWAHVRRDFIDEGKKDPEILGWVEDWLDIIGLLYHENNKRVKYYTDGLDTEFKIAQAAVEKVVSEIKQKYTSELNNKNLHDAKRAILTSLDNHWPGLTVFVSFPEVKMDNNPAERALRGPVNGRKDFYGSGSVWSSELSATMFSIFTTLELWGINKKTWLTLFLQSCAANHGKLPDNWKSDFLPWNMSATRIKIMKLPLCRNLDSS